MLNLGCFCWTVSFFNFLKNLLMMQSFRFDLYKAIVWKGAIKINEALCILYVEEREWEKNLYIILAQTPVKRGVWGICWWQCLCMDAVVPFSGWLNCTGPHATPSSDVRPPEVAGIATATPRTTVSTHWPNYVRVTSLGSGLVIEEGRWGSLAMRSNPSRRWKTPN